MKEVRTGYKYRFYPTEAQERALARTFGCVRYVYNWALEVRSRSYRENGESVSWVEANRRLTILKRDPETEWLQDVCCTPLTQALRHLDRAYYSFFRGNSKYPRFKSRRHRQSATYTAKALWMAESSIPGQPLITLFKIGGPLRIRWSRPLPSKPSSVTVIREADGRYYVSFVVKVTPLPLERTNQVAGVDLGLNDLVVTSDGWHSGNPKHLRKAQDRLAILQRRLAKKQNGSASWHKQRRKVSRIHARVANQRRDFLHQLSTRLVRRYDVIYTESLNVAGMVSNHNLARAISDAGWGMFVQMLSYKADWYGRQLVQVDRWYPSSKTCSACGHQLKALPLNVRCWTCPKCEAKNQRDVNAARNILAVGHTAEASGLGIRPVLALANGAAEDEGGISQDCRGNVNHPKEEG